MADEEIGARLKLKDRKQFSDDADKAGKSVKKIGDEAKESDRKLRTMGGSGGGIGLVKHGLAGLRTIALVGAAAIAGVGFAAGVAGVKMVSLASDAAETASAFTTVFGPATAEVSKFVDSVNRDFGIPVAELQNATRQFGVFAKAADLPQDKLSDFSTSLAQAGLDLGSFYNIDTNEVFQALQSGLSGETEPLRKFGIFMSEAGLTAFAASQGIAKTTEQMTDQEKVALRQQFILANLGDAQGDLARTSKGLANQWRGLKGRLTSAGTAIGTAVLPFVTKLVNTLNDKLGPIIEELTWQAPLFGDAFHAAFSGEGITTRAGSLVGIAERLGVAARFLTEQWGAFSQAWNTAGLAGVTGELDKMLGTGTLLSDTVAELQSIFQSLGGIWTDLILPVLEDFNDAIPRWIRPLGIVSKVLGWIADNGETLQPILFGLLATFIAFKVVSGILNAVAAAQALLNTVMTMNPVGLAIVAIAALAAGLIYAYNHSEIFRAIVQAVFKAVSKAAGWLVEKVQLLWDLTEGLRGFLVGAFSKAWGEVKFAIDLLTIAGGWLFDKLQSIWDKSEGLRGFLGGAFSTGIGIAIQAFEDFVVPIKWVIEQLGKVWDAANDAYRMVQLALGQDVSVSLINALPNGVTSMLPTGSTPPRLHSGGTTTSPGVVNMRPGEELIVLPQAASVIPMNDTVANMARAGSTDKSPTVLQVVLDGKVLAESVYDHAGDTLARR